MTETAKLLLQLFEGTDNFDYRVLNRNWEKVEEAMKTLSEQQGSVVSPTITTQRITNGYRITIKDATGSKSIDLYNGDDGIGVKSIARTSGNGAAGTTDTYTITYTNNTTETFSIYNGKDYVLTENDKSTIAAEAATAAENNIKNRYVHISISGSTMTGTLSDEGYNILKNGGYIKLDFDGYIWKLSFVREHGSTGAMDFVGVYSKDKIITIQVKSDKTWSVTSM